MRHAVVQFCFCFSFSAEYAELALGEEEELLPDTSHDMTGFLLQLLRSAVAKRFEGRVQLCLSRPFLKNLLARLKSVWIRRTNLQLTSRLTALVCVSVFFPFAQNITKWEVCANVGRDERGANPFKRICVALALLQRKSCRQWKVTHLSERLNFQSGGRIATLQELATRKRQETNLLVRPADEAVVSCHSSWNFLRQLGHWRFLSSL